MYSECFLQVCEVWLEAIGHKTSNSSSIERRDRHNISLNAIYIGV